MLWDEILLIAKPISLLPPFPNISLTPIPSPPIFIIFLLSCHLLPLSAACCSLLSCFCRSLVLCLSVAANIREFKVIQQQQHLCCLLSCQAEKTSSGVLFMQSFNSIIT